MADDSTDPKADPQTDPKSDPVRTDDPPKPPWGSDEEFKPDVAWKAIQNARETERKLKEERDALRAEKQERERADESAQQKAEREKSEAAQQAAEAKAEATRLRMAIKYGLDEEDLDLLGTGDEDAIEKRAKRLAERVGATNGGSSRRPQERLKPGAVRSTDPDSDDDMNARLRRATGRT